MLRSAMTLCKSRAVADPGGGFRGLEPPFFQTINAFEWGHIVGTPLGPGFGTPLFKKAGSAPEEY